APPTLSLHAALPICPGDRLVQREQAALRGRVVPVLGRIAAVTGATGDVDQASAGFLLDPVAHRETTQLRGGGQVDSQRVFPRVRSEEHTSELQSREN